VSQTGVEFFTRGNKSAKRPR